MLYSIRKALVKFARHVRSNRRDEAVCIAVMRRFLATHFDVPTVYRCLTFFHNLVHSQTSQTEMSFVGSLFVCCRPPIPPTTMPTIPTMPSIPSSPTMHTALPQLTDQTDQHPYDSDSDLYFDCQDHTNPANHTNQTNQTKQTKHTNLAKHTIDASSEPCASPELSFRKIVHSNVRHNHHNHHNHHKHHNHHNHHKHKTQFRI
jgi:hypothetical protein